MIGTAEMAKALDVLIQESRVTFYLVGNLITTQVRPSSRDKWPTLDSAPEAVAAYRRIHPDREPDEAVAHLYSMATSPKDISD